MQLTTMCQCVSLNVRTLYIHVYLFAIATLLVIFITPSVVLCSIFYFLKLQYVHMYVRNCVVARNRGNILHVCMYVCTYICQTTVCTPSSAVSLFFFF